MPVSDVPAEIEYNDVKQLSNLMGIGFIFVLPVYFSEAQLGSVSWISVIIPTSNVVGLMRSYVGSLPTSIEAVVVRWAVLIITTTAFIMLTFVKARWREK